MSAWEKVMFGALTFATVVFVICLGAAMLIMALRS